MQNEAEKRAIELPSGCEVCGDSSYPQYFVPDLFYKVKLDDPEGGRLFDRRVLHCFCQTHARPGKLIVEQESKDVYFARLRATEGAEI
jgi:hypothetical protein